MFIILFVCLSLYASAMIEIPHQKHCIKCKYSTHNNGLMPGKCILYPRSVTLTGENRHKDLVHYLVNGEEREKLVEYLDYYYCSTARQFNSMCGMDGKQYEAKKW
jgi:hypothetical protein